MKLKIWIYIKTGKENINEIVKEKALYANYFRIINKYNTRNPFQ